MNSDKFLNNRFRWVIMIDTDEAEKFDEVDFMVIHKVENLFNPEYTMMEIEALIDEPEYTVEDVLCMTGAIAVHEEWTNGVVIPVEALDTIADEIYPWEKAGGCFLGDMLTSLERLNFLMKFFYDETKEMVTIDDITVREKKDGPKKSLSEHVDELFTLDLHSAQFKDKDVVLWWQSIIEERGLFLVVLDDELLDDEDDDTPPYKSPYRNFWGDYYDDVYGYGSPYDDYDYDDRYYQRT